MIHRLAFASAVLAVGTLAAFTLVGGLLFPGYSHAAQFISELGAAGAPHEMQVRFLGFLPAGALLLLFVAGALLTLPRSPSGTVGFLGLAVYAAGYLAAAAFPCDPGCRPAEPSISQLLHNLFGTVGYLLAPMFLALLGWSARRWPGGAHLAAPAFAAAVVAFLCLLGLDPDFAYVGLVQRVLEASVSLWVLLCARYLRTRGGAPA